MPGNPINMSGRCSKLKENGSSTNETQQKIHFYMSSPRTKPWKLELLESAELCTLRDCQLALTALSLVWRVFVSIRV